MHERGAQRMHKWGDSHVRDTQRAPLVGRSLYGFIEDHVLCVFSALLRWVRPFTSPFPCLGLKQDERVTTDVSFAACMQRMEPSGQQHIATTNLLRVAAVQTGPEMGCCCIGDWNSGRGGVGRAAFVDGSPSSTTGASV